jgi:hypothetical protein
MERHATHTPRKRWRCVGETTILGILDHFLILAHLVL